MVLVIRDSVGCLENGKSRVNSVFILNTKLVINSSLILQAKKLEISFIEIPLVDSSSLKTPNDKIDLRNSLEKVIPLAEKNDVILIAGK